MKLFDRKIVFLVALSLALASAARAQDNTCSLQLNPVTFIEGTIATNAVEEVSLTLTGSKKQEFKASPASASLFEGLPEGNYKIAATKPGFRTTQDFIYLSCSNSPQSIATKMVIMWEGDPAKTVDYTRVLQPQPAKSDSKDQQIMIGEADGSPRIESGAPAVTTKARPVNGTQGSLTLGGPISDAGANAAPDSSTVNKGVINGSAIVLAKPKYPPSAKAVGASGSVMVQVTIDEDGYVIEADPVSGHPLLRAVSALAAKASRFTPTLLLGQPVKVRGIIVYNFQ
jgi:TonB family protein